MPQASFEFFAVVTIYFLWDLVSQITVVIAAFNFVFLIVFLVKHPECFHSSDIYHMDIRQKALIKPKSFLLNVKTNFLSFNLTK